MSNKVLGMHIPESGLRLTPLLSLAPLLSYTPCVLHLLSYTLCILRLTPLLSYTPAILQPLL